MFENSNLYEVGIIPRCQDLVLDTHLFRRAYSQEYPSPVYPAHAYPSPSISSYPVPN